MSVVCISGSANPLMVCMMASWPSIAETKLAWSSYLTFLMITPVGSSVVLSKRVMVTVCFLVLSSASTMSLLTCPPAWHIVN